MENAIVQALPALVAVEFPHGKEAVPTIINGLPVRYASIDDDGAIVAWSSLTPPVFGGGAWCLGEDDLLGVGIVGEDDGTEYPHAAASLRRITVNDMMAA